jgi:hypothetical protein
MSHDRLSQFENEFVPFAVSLPPKSVLRQQLAPLCRDLCEILASIEAGSTSDIEARWEKWRDRFASINDAALDEKLEEFLIDLSL